MEKRVIDKPSLVCIKGNRLLSARSKGKDKFYLPGGKRNEWETDMEALIRESKEELDVDLIPESIKFIGAFEGQAHGKAEGTMVKLTCYVGDFKGEARASSEIEEIAWLSYEEKEKYPENWVFLFDWLREKKLLL
jgi:8-oxo-dGTP diphosphatase